jgi:hypothetical protein
MSTNTTPLPPAGHFVEAVRDSSHVIRKAAKISVRLPTISTRYEHAQKLISLQIETDSVKRLLLSPALTTTFQRLASSHGYAFPFKFASALSELNFLSILSLINFASGYRVPLHRLTGRGAYDNIRALVFSLYLTSAAETGGADPLSARGMAGISSQTVAELMGLSLHVERPHESIPGVTVGELGGPGFEVASLVAEAMNSTGKVLVDGGYPDLGSFVLEALKEGEKVRATKGSEGEINIVLERVRLSPPS